MTQGTSNAVFNLLNLCAKRPANDAKRPADDTEFLTLAQQMELEKHRLEEEEEEELEEQEIEEEELASEDEVRTVLIRKCSPFVPHPNLVAQVKSENTIAANTQFFATTWPSTTIDNCCGNCERVGS
jgi:hypothetical protein